MADDTLIEWTRVPGAVRGATWNITTGCTKVSPACKNCCAERDWQRLSKNPKAAKYYGRSFDDVQTHPELLDQPIRWTKPRGILVDLMSDMFHEKVSFEFLDKVFAVMALAHWHTFLGLTKRAVRMHSYLTQASADELIDRWVSAAADMGHTLRREEVSFPLHNLWLGVTVENQEEADWRVPLLLQTPATKRFLSCEPLLGPVDLTRIGGDPFGWGRIDAVNGLLYIRANATESGCDWETQRVARIDWVITGGESGPRARPSHLLAFRSLRDQCQAAGVAFFFKQWGEYLCGPFIKDEGVSGGAYVEALGKVAITSARRFPNDDHYAAVRLGRRKTGHHLDGQLHREYPT